MKGFTRDKKFIPMTDYKKVTRKSRDQKEKTQGIRLKRKAKKNLTNKDKQILRDWVKQNPNWTSIDDLPNEIFIPLVSSAGDNIDKRVEIQVEAIDFMKSVTPKSRKKRDEQVITIDGHSTILPADPNSSEDEDRHAEQTVRIGLVKRRQALALIKKSSPKGISDWEIREILGSEALPEIRVLSKIDKTVVEKDGIFKVAKK